MLQFLLAQIGKLKSIVSSLSDKTDITVTVPEGWTKENFVSYKIGKLVYISGSLKTSDAVVAKEINLGTIIPEGYRPSGNNVTFAAFNNSSDKAIHGIITTTGAILMYRPDTDSLTQIVLTAVYSIA